MPIVTLSVELSLLAVSPSPHSKMIFSNVLLSSQLLYPAPLIGPDTTAILVSGEEVQHGLAVRETEQRASGESNDSLGTAALSRLDIFASISLAG